MIIKGKRLYVTRMRNRQFLTNREMLQSSDGSEYEYTDGIFVSTLMPDISFGEGFRFVDLHIETKEFPGAHQMWVTGRFRHRVLTEEKPDIEGRVTGGDALFLKFNCDEDFFPHMPECTFPVWVECLKGGPYNEDDYRQPLVFDSIGMLDRDGNGRASFSDRFRGQLERFLDDNNLSFLNTPVECRIIIEIPQKVEV